MLIDTKHCVGNLFIEDNSPEITFETTNASHVNWQIAAQEWNSQSLQFASGSTDSDASNDTFTPRLTIKSDGKVGIGTAAPTSELHVAGHGNITGSLTTPFVYAVNGFGSNGNNLIYFNSSSNYAKISTNGAERMRIDSAGKVGIGTATPAAELHVYRHSTGFVKIQNQSEFIGNTGGNAWRFYNYDTGGSSLWVSDGSTTSLIVKGGAGGKVGIGTAAPGAQLHVYENDNGAWAAQFDNVHATGWGALIRGGADSGDYSLLVRDYNQNDLFTIRGNGNVGIGTNGPDAPLHVARASDYKVIKLGDDITSHYVMSGNSDHTLTLTCGSYFQAEIVITAHQTNGGTYNNLYMRGIWSNNHTSHHWDEIENVGDISGSTFTITVGQDGSTTNSGEWKIVHDYTSGTFVKFTVRVTDFYNTHSYTIS